MKTIYVASCPLPPPPLNGTELAVFTKPGTFLKLLFGYGVSDIASGGAGSLSACKTPQGEPKVMLITAVNPKGGNYKAVIKTNQTLQMSQPSSTEHQVDRESDTRPPPE